MPAPIQPTRVDPGANEAMSAIVASCRTRPNTMTLRPRARRSVDRAAD